MGIVHHKMKASFAGKHNRLKAKVLIVLRQHEVAGIRGRRNILRGMTSHQIADQVGATANNVSLHITKWAKWRYVKRQLGVSPLKGKPCYVFRIDTKGKGWLKWNLPEGIEAELKDELNKIEGRLYVY